MPRFIHVGCGEKSQLNTTPEFKKPEWSETRFDIDESVKPDILGSMTDMSGAETEGYDALYSSHNIEHLHTHEVSIAIGEFHRVIKEDAYVVLTCPDLQQIGQYLTESRTNDLVYNSPAGPIYVLDILFGHGKSIQEGNSFMAHHTGFTIKSLMFSFTEGGFSKCIGKSRRGYFDLWLLASKNDRTDDEMKALAKRHFPQ